MQELKEFKTINEIQEYINVNLPNWSVERMSAKGQPNISIYHYQDFAEILKVYRPEIDGEKKLFMKFVKGIYTEYPDHVVAVSANDSWIGDSKEGVRAIVYENDRLVNVPRIMEMIKKAFMENPIWKRYIDEIDTIHADDWDVSYDGTWSAYRNPKRHFSISVKRGKVSVNF